MKVLQNILNIFRRDTPAPPPQAVVAAPVAYPSWLVSSGPSTQISTVYRCVSLLSDAVATLPLQYLRRRGPVYEPVADSRLWYLLTVQPSATVNACEMMRQAVAQVLLRGNAYIVPVYNKASLDIESLVLCSPGTVSHDYANDTYTVSDPWNQLSGTYGEDAIIHLKGATFDNPKRGLSVLTFASRTLSIATAGDCETLNRFENGGSVHGIITNDSRVRGFGDHQDKELEAMSRQMTENFRSGQHIISLPGSVDFKQISLSSADMQFLETRKFTVREICRFFGVHPSFVFDDTSNNYKSAEQANMAFLSLTLNPLLRNIEIEFQRKLVSPRLAGDYQFCFDRHGLYACDLESKMKFRSMLLQTGATVNEVRRMDNRPPVDGGDRVFVSQNIKGIDEMAPQPNNLKT